MGMTRGSQGVSKAGGKTLHVGVMDVICRAKLHLDEEGKLQVEVMDGVREFELEAWEVECLFEMICAHRRRAAEGTGRV